MNFPRIQAGSLGAVVLAGGRSARLPDKCFKILENKELIVHVFGKISQVTQEIVVAVKSVEQVGCVGHVLPAAHVVLDETKDQSPLVGFLSGLHAIKAQYVFVAPCDTPFVEPDVIRLLLQRALGKDGAIPIVNGKMLEPLCAVYRRESAVRSAQESIESGGMSMLDMVEKLEDITRVPIEELRKVDPQLLTFRNINTAEDLVWAERTIQYMMQK